MSRLLFDLVCTYGVPMRHVGNVIQRTALELGVDFPRKLRQLIIAIQWSGKWIFCCAARICRYRHSHWAATVDVGVHACLYGF